MDPSLGAIEVIRTRFEQEAKIMASLDHPGITKVIDFDEKTITMKLDNADDENKDIVIVNKTDFHKSFVCNYCSTTHKNQGATIDRNIQLWDWDKMTIDRRIGYTAVSRARKMEQVKIII